MMVPAPSERGDIAKRGLYNTDIRERLHEGAVQVAEHLEFARVTMRARRSEGGGVCRGSFCQLFFSMILAFTSNMGRMAQRRNIFCNFFWRCL